MRFLSPGESAPVDRVGVFSASVYLYAVAGYLAFGAWFAAAGHAAMLAEYSAYASIFACCHVLARRKRRRAGLFLALATICFSSVRSDWLFGWDMGAHYYILASAALVLGAETIAPRLKLLLCAPIIGVFCAAWVLLGDRAARIPLFPPWDSLMNEINLLCAFGVLALSFMRYSDAVVVAERRLEEANATIRDIANTDALTGTCNRRFTEEILRSAMRLDVAESLVVGMVDIDGFKAINDAHGHEAGDEVLKELCRRIQGSLRRDDVLGRWGGEEFLIILRGVDRRQGFDTMERLRRVVAAEPFALRGDREIRVTVTVGMAIGRRSRMPESIVGEADRLLYEGKRGGKNRVVAEMESPAVARAAAADGPAGATRP